MGIPKSPDVNKYIHIYMYIQGQIPMEACEWWEEEEGDSGEVAH